MIRLIKLGRNSRKNFLYADTLIFLRMLLERPAHERRKRSKMKTRAPALAFLLFEHFLGQRLNLFLFIFA